MSCGWSAYRLCTVGKVSGNVMGVGVQYSGALSIGPYSLVQMLVEAKTWILAEVGISEPIQFGYQHSEELMQMVSCE